MKKNKNRKGSKAAAVPRRFTKLDLSVLLTAFLLLVERLPKGVMMRFADESQTYIEYYSYFDMLPFGYGDFFPMITAWLTVVVGLLLLGYRFLKKEKLRETALLLTYVTFGAAMVALFMGMRFGENTVIRVCVPVLLLVLIQLLHKNRME